MLNEGQVLPVETTMETIQQPSVGIVESFKNAIQPETIANKLGIDKNTLIDIALFGAIGCLFGFLLKKYSEYFIAFALFIVGIIILQQFGYVSVGVNVSKVHEVLGIQAAPMTTDGYGMLMLEWMKSNVSATASIIIGFLVGMKCA